MPWLARHDPVIDWTKRTIVHFGSSSVTRGCLRSPHADTHD
ncbi:hypothetical protein PF008_g29377 [Phytophthora fragariae]|uniref:Uncharacterized protein n=1 Tax=Phytophthora fragariae TaxID=53985 RepID=A0A6G0Q9E6_9STRA|nr:hypothetical protein PF008_g29377 [Phytophthora fragariae]